MRTTVVRLLLAAWTVASTLVAVSVAGAPPAHAADNGLWSVFPSSLPGSGGKVRPFFEVDLRPGLPATDSVAISNKTDQPLTFLLYAADALNLDNGGFGLQPPNKPQRDLGAWIELPGTQLTVPARSMVNLPFTINVPQDATPGDHVGGIVAVNKAVTQQETQSDSGGRGSLSVQNAVGTRVYGRVAGPLKPSLRITDIEIDHTTSVASLFGAPTDVSVSYTVQNTGNVRLTPTATGEVSSLFGAVSEELPRRKLPELLPRNEVTIRERVTDVLPWLRLSASVTAVAGDTRATGEASTLVIPWLFLLVLVLVAAGVWWWRRRRARAAPTMKKVKKAKKAAKAKELVGS
jgi:LPXTG-motif cell wall-anchored protein